MDALNSNKHGVSTFSSCTAKDERFLTLEDNFLLVVFCSVYHASYTTESATIYGVQSPRLFVYIICTVRAELPVA